MLSTGSPTVLERGRYRVVNLHPSEFEANKQIGELFASLAPSVNEQPDIDHIVKLFTVLGDAAIMLVAYHDDEPVGMLAAVLSPDMFSGTLTALEQAWFVHPAHRGIGVLLFREFEKWGKDAGAVYLGACHMVDSMPEQVSKFYERRGYVKTDVLYRKEI